MAKEVESPPDKKKTQIIVIKRPRNGGHGHHGGAWKVAYADFVTAMMALFIVLWLMGADDDVKKAISSFFTNPSGPGKLTGTAAAPAPVWPACGRLSIESLRPAEYWGGGPHAGGLA